MIYIQNIFDLFKWDGGSTTMLRVFLVLAIVPLLLLIYASESKGGMMGACCSGPGFTMCTAPTPIGQCINSFSGLFQGDGTDCNPNPCPTPTPGPPDELGCCFPDGSCADIEFEAVFIVCPNNDGEVQGNVCANVTCPQPTPTGACCDASGFQSCDIETADNCDEGDGEYQGDGISCDPNPCIPNDECTDADGPLDIPSVAFGTTTNATSDDPPAFQCGDAVGANPGIWYTLIGNGNQIYASTCDDFPFQGTADYDTQISIFCDDCENLTCVDGNDDDCSGGSLSELSTVSFCSQSGALYRILVHGFGGATGDFALNIMEGGSCDTAIECLPSGACCLPDASCAELTEAGCNSAGGSYQGDGSECAQVECTVPTPTPTATPTPTDAPTPTPEPDGPEEPTGPAVIIPTLSEWGMIIITLILGFYAVFKLRRRIRS